MTFNLKLLPRAEFEISNAALWYKFKEEKLEVKFLNDLQEILNRIAQNPFQFQLNNRKFRQAKFTKFPFIVIYKVIDENFILIFSIFNTHQNPSKKP